MADSEDTNAAADVPAKPGGMNKVLPLILIINTLLMVGVLIFVMKKPAAHADGGDEGKAKEGEGEKSEHGSSEKSGHGGGGKEEGAVGPTVRFDNFTVQLKSNDVERYAHMSLELELFDEAGKAIIERRSAPIRDAVLGYLTDRTAEELRGSDGLRDVKTALLKRLEEIVPGKRIANVFITDFIIQ
ncbi:MAG TPA: flagellar basal body-associated FliL family protein [Polyangia bacterium]|jgi:flagellar protein FliL|nr:flagellar basal body-associated FliL family protein [Polyangia bacterium]